MTFPPLHVHVHAQDSLIPETLKQMENDEEFQLTAEKLRKMGQAKLTREERKKRQRALDHLGVPNFRDFLKTFYDSETGGTR